MRFAAARRLAWCACLPGLASACLPEQQLQLFVQQSYVWRADARWRIAANRPWRTHNGYSDMAVQYDHRCRFPNHRLAAEATLAGVAVYPWHSPGDFAQDNRRVRLLIPRLNVSWALSDAVSLTVGKLQAPAGLFYLKSPTALLPGYYAGFQSSRIYDAAWQETYSESAWGLRLAAESRDYAWSLTATPQLARIPQRYQASGNWPALARSNASARYLLTYTDYRQRDHTPTVSLRLGDGHVLAVADSFRPAPQWTLNAALAWHARQQWRHFAGQRARQVAQGAFPSSLYQRDHRAGIELALGGHYTADDFSQSGVEYYFQSEGYSRHQWRRQMRFIDYLHQRTSSGALASVMNAYKYLMAAESDNVANQGNLQGRHYLHGYATLALRHQLSLRAYSVLNLQDSSMMFGLQLSKALTRPGRNLDIYGGIYATQGGGDTEFGLFGAASGIYSGLKYYF